MTSTSSPSTYNYNWHWYDGSGLRVVTHVTTGSSWIPTTAPTSGMRTYFVYDGADVAMTLVGPPTGSWRIQQRFVSTGVDQPIGGWFNTNGGGAAQNLAFVTDHQGSVRAAIRADGTRENDAVYFARGAFGNLEAPTTSGEGSTQTNTQTGYTGASTTNTGGGFTYLRNRWYDPATGRFLTQDPIGLAGGVNLYAYADNDPVSFDDPFGLCTRRDGWKRCRTGEAIRYWSERARGSDRSLERVRSRFMQGLAYLGETLLEGSIDLARSAMPQSTCESRGEGGRVCYGTLPLVVPAGVSAPPRPTTSQIVEAVAASGAGVKPHPTRTGQGVAIDFGDGTKIDIRVENHPPHGLHGNVERWENGVRTQNTHVPPDRP